jgi:hypothetical protein
VQKIVVAAGLEIRDFQGSKLLEFLNANADAGKGSMWTYPKGAGAKATHEVYVVYTMTEFANALEADNAYVIYEGHSRYGQGPAFGPARPSSLRPDEHWVPDKAAFPVNPWGVHFRMGYDATDTECIDDLVEHSVTPTEYDLVTASAKAFLPTALETAATRAKAVEKTIKAGKLKRTKLCPVRGAWRSFDTCDPALAATTTARGDQPLKGRHYYAQKVRKKRKPKKPEDEFLTSVQVGSTDLDKSSLKCKVLFMASCSSHVHFFKPLKKRRKAVKSACKFYMTGMICSAFHGRNFIEQIFKGHDPTTNKGSKAILKALNGVANSGIVGIY